MNTASSLCLLLVLVIVASVDCSPCRSNVLITGQSLPLDLLLIAVLVIWGEDACTFLFLTPIHPKRLTDFLYSLLSV